VSFNADQTSKRVASEASGLLRTKTASKTAKSVAGSALAQTPFKGGTLTKLARLAGKKQNVGSLMKGISRRKSF
jgi:hypothetical protein